MSKELVPNDSHDISKCQFLVYEAEIGRVKIEKPEKARDMGCYKILIDKTVLPQDENNQPKINIELFGDATCIELPNVP